MRLPSPQFDDLEDWYGGDPADIVEADPDAVRAELRRRSDRLVPAWHERAACRGTDTALFFPRRGESNKPAIAICDRCPVSDACLDEALGDNDLDVGIRGGMSAKARKARRRLLATRKAS